MNQKPNFGWIGTMQTKSSILKSVFSLVKNLKSLRLITMQKIIALRLHLLDRMAQKKPSQKIRKGFMASIQKLNQINALIALSEVA